MDLYVLRRAEPGTERPSGPSAFWCDRVVVAVEGRRRAEPIAMCTIHNLLEPDPRALPPFPRSIPGETLVAWSGWIDDRPDDVHLPEGVFASSFRTWSGLGQERFAALCDAVARPLAERGAMLAFRPHARHVLSDTQSCVNFLKAREGEPFTLLLEPAALLTDTMLSQAEEHLERIFDTLATHPGVTGVMLSNLERVKVPWGGSELRSVPIHRGLLDPDLLCRPAARLVPRGTPVLLWEEQLAPQLGVVRPASRGL